MMYVLWRRTAGNQRGSVFLAGIMLVAVMTLVGVALFDLASIEAALTTGDTASTQLLYCANSALGRTMIDNTPGGRVDQMNNLVTNTPGKSITWAETVPTRAVGCTNTIVFTDDTALGRRLLQATSSSPAGTRRTARVQVNFLPAYFNYAVVANNGDFFIRGSGTVPTSGPGGADVINGDVFVAGRVFVGTPASACAGSLCTSSAQINPRSTTDNNPTVSVPTGSTWTQAKADNSSAWPAPGDSLPFGYRSNMPQVNVAAYVASVQSVLGITAANPNGNLVATYLGSPVFNINAIFSALGSNSDGSLRAPSGCGCGVATGNCAIYCQLKPLAVMMNPSDRTAENTATTGADVYFDGVHTGEEFPSPKTGEEGAQRLVDFTAVTSQPPILFVTGNAHFNQLSDYGFAISGRGTIVATTDVLLSDNLIYKDGLAPAGGCQSNPASAACNPATADMLGLVAGRDIWYGDPRYGTFYEGSGVMLAGRDFNFVFFDNSGNPTTPDNAIILNGSMLANRQVAVFRDFANPSGSSSTSACPAGTTSCQPIAFDPLTTTCGSANGCWRFIVRDSSGNIAFDASKLPFIECQPAGGKSPGGCSAGSRVISHYQMTLNYDNRLFTNSQLAPPGLPTGTGLFANSWRDWQECPPCN
ncbi:MAG TPA: hypothetical protein VEL75_03035 [Candidatus Methylomirabilis sp.]|nr:hypothetical protein [Candidatus Methylomirabilis sp.]